jgi:phosphoribosylamine-glycine ligase
MEIPPVTITLEPARSAQIKYSAILFVMVLLQLEWYKGIPYNVVVRDSESDEVLYTEGPLDGPDAQTAQSAIAQSIRQLGISGFLYRKEHGWRIDLGPPIQE